MERRLHQDATLKGLDSRFVGPAQVAAKEPWLQAIQQCLAKLVIAGNGPGLEHLLAVPSAAEVVEADDDVLGGMRCSQSGTVGERNQLNLSNRIVVSGLTKQALHEPGNTIEM